MEKGAMTEGREVEWAREENRRLDKAPQNPTSLSDLVLSPQCTQYCPTTADILHHFRVILN